jgi:predicted aspartyl protease
MGTFYHAITLFGPQGASETVQALVDTGALFSVAPTPLLKRLGIRPFRTMPVRFANGQTETWPVGQVEAELLGRRMPILCLFGTADVPALIGAHALEAFLLMVDPVERTLVPKDAVDVM